jgi:hypothetical protein
MAACMVERRVERAVAAVRRTRFNCHVSAILGFGHERHPESGQASTEGQVLCGVERAHVAGRAGTTRDVEPKVWASLPSECEIKLRRH